MGKVICLVHLFSSDVASFLAVRLGNAAPPSEDKKSESQNLTDILERIRQDIGYYETEVTDLRANQDVDPAYKALLKQLGNESNKVTPCDTSQYDFNVKKISLDIQGFTSSDNDYTGGIQIPFIENSSLRGGGELKFTHSATQEITLDRFYTYDRKNLPQLPSVLKGQTPIANALLALRYSLITSSIEQPCFKTTDPGSQSPSDTIKLVFVVESNINPTIGFNIWLLNAQYEHDNDSKFTNTLTITFVPVSGRF